VVDTHTAETESGNPKTIATEDAALHVVLRSSLTKEIRPRPEKIASGGRLSSLLSPIVAGTGRMHFGALLLAARGKIAVPSS